MAAKKAWTVLYFFVFGMLISCARAEDNACSFYSNADEAYQNRQFRDCIDFANKAVALSTPDNNYIECNDESIIDDYDPSWFLAACECENESFLDAYSDYQNAKYELPEEYETCLSTGKMCSLLDKAINTCDIMSFRRFIDAAEQQGIELIIDDEQNLIYSMLNNINKVACGRNQHLYVNKFLWKCRFSFVRYMCALEKTQESCSNVSHYCYWSEISGLCNSIHEPCNSFETKEQCDAVPANAMPLTISGAREAAAIFVNGDKEYIRSEGIERVNSEEDCNKGECIIKNISASEDSETGEEAYYQYSMNIKIDTLMNAENDQRTASCFWYAQENTCKLISSECNLFDTKMTCNKNDCRWNSNKRLCETKRSVAGCLYFDESECRDAWDEERCYWNNGNNQCYSIETSCIFYFTEEACHGVAHRKCNWYDSETSSFCEDKYY